MRLDKITHFYDLDSLLSINDGFQNKVFLATKKGKEYILRFTDTKRRSLDELKAELFFVLELAHLGISVAKPITSKYGSLIQQMEGEYVSAFEKAPGLPVIVSNESVWNKDLFYEWGTILGKIHKASRQLNIKLDRPTWTKENPDLLQLLPRISSEVISERYFELLSALKDFQLKPSLFGLIHNDFHQGNFLVEHGNITIFDFDDCAYNWFAYDLATSFYHAYWQTSSFTPEKAVSFLQEFWKNFLKGYQQEVLIHKEIIEQIPIFLKIREIFLYVLFLEKWDINHLEEWQEYTLTDLKQRIEGKIPYASNDLGAIIVESIDNLR